MTDPKTSPFDFWHSDDTEKGFLFLLCERGNDNTKNCERNKSVSNCNHFFPRGHGFSQKQANNEEGFAAQSWLENNLYQFLRAYMWARLGTTKRQNASNRQIRKFLLLSTAAPYHRFNFVSKVALSEYASHLIGLVPCQPVSPVSTHQWLMTTSLVMWCPLPKGFPQQKSSEVISSALKGHLDPVGPVFHDSLTVSQC